jgi:hypothetical protein
MAIDSRSEHKRAYGLRTSEDKERLVYTRLREQPLM